jgi:hypothetical protein
MPGAVYVWCRERTDRAPMRGDARDVTAPGELISALSLLGWSYLVFLLARVFYIEAQGTMRYGYPLWTSLNPLSVRQVLSFCVSLVPPLTLICISSVLRRRWDGS